MPNKTIYVKESDLPIWARAQRELGESISGAFVDYLRERLEAEARRKKTNREGRMNETQAMNALLAEINAELNMDIELDPFWKYPILDQNTMNHGYKLHQKNGNPDRVMSLVVCPLDFDESGSLNQQTGVRIKRAIKKFWDGKTEDPHTFLDATK